MNLQLVAERGERDVAAEVEGNVYIPAGCVYIYLYKINGRSRYEASSADILDS
jgi:hypothetical protein